MPVDPSADHEASSTTYLVRVGTQGQIRRLLLSEPLTLLRGEPVLCRTDRGLERGLVVGRSTGTSEWSDGCDGVGRILRRCTSEDELLWSHLQRLGEEAYTSCVAWLERQPTPALLLEVEPLMDGQTLYFHFLSEVDSQIQSQLDQLVQLYEERVRASKFAQLLEHGCGPGCGTAAAKNGCGTRGGCAVCKIAGACASKGQSTDSKGQSTDSTSTMTTATPAGS